MTPLTALYVRPDSSRIHDHFGSKPHLYRAVFAEVERLVLDRFLVAVEGETSFLGKVGAVLDAAVALQETDREAARFAGSVAGDLARLAELRDAVPAPWQRRDSFLDEVVAFGIANGHIAAADRAEVLELLIAIVEGLILVGNALPGTRTRAAEGFKRLFGGTFTASVPDTLKS